MSVPAGISLIVPAVSRGGVPAHPPARAVAARRPQLRSGWSLKRLDAGEGEERYVLKDHRCRRLLALADPEAELAQLLDGDHDLVELIGEADAALRRRRARRLARLLAELADRGLLAGVDREDAAPTARRAWLAERVRPRERRAARRARAMASVYRHGG